LIVASAQIFHYAWGRANVGRWTLAVLLLFLHPEVRSGHAYVGFDLLGDLLLGLSMMIVVLHDSRVQIQRLDVLTNITPHSSNSGGFEPAVRSGLQHLTEMARARAAWFRILEGEDLVLFAEVGLSPNYVEAAKNLLAAKSVSAYAMRERELCVLLATEAAPAFRDKLKAEGIHHLVLVPVEGKSSRIGTLVMGM